MKMEGRTCTKQKARRLRETRADEDGEMEMDKECEVNVELICERDCCYGAENCSLTDIVSAS